MSVNLLRTFIAALKRKINGTIGNNQTLTCTAKAAIAAGQLVEIAAAASSLVDGSVASVSACGADSTSVFGIAMNTVTAEGQKVDVMPLEVGDILSIQFSGTAPSTMGTKYGLHTTGELIITNTTADKAIYKVMGNVVAATSGYEGTCDVQVVSLDGHVG